MPETVWLTAPAPVTAAEHDSRVIRGLAVPWDELGDTSAGRLRVRRSGLRLPQNLRRLKLLAGHRGGSGEPEPVGYATEANDTDAGLELAFHIARTPAGDQALLEAAEGVRDGLSVELHDMHVTGDEVTDAYLAAVAQVPVPAWQQATLAATLTDPPEHEQPELPEPEPEPEPAPEPEQPEEDQAVTDTTIEAPAPTVTASLPPELGRRTTGIQTMADLYAALRAQATGRAGPDVTAALADITHTANAWAQATQYEGELWTGVATERTIVPLVAGKALTGYTVNGWRWKVKPAVATYAGDKAPVTSNAAVTEAATATAQRLAGAHDIDRKFRDFNDTEFFASYYAAMAESYALLSDQACLTDLLAAATALTPAVGAKIVQIMTQMYLTVAKYGTPAYVVYGDDVALALSTVTAANAPALLGLAQNPLSSAVYSPLIPAGTLVAVAKPAFTFYELPGSPIRVEAVNLPNGGVDEGVFGYFATIANDKRAIVKVTGLTPVPTEAPTEAAAGK